MKRCMVSISILIFIVFSSVVFASDRISLGYIYNSSKSHTEIVNNTNGNINVVSPTCFDLTNDGHLDINNIFNQEFIYEMHDQGILVTPFLSNHWGRKRAEAALKKPEILADEVVAAILKYDLDGVNVDLENLLPKDKDKLTNFVKILREKLPDGKILSVAVAANPNKLTKTWVAAYDYEALAMYADYLVLMAYDEHSSGGVAGPVASIDFVEESVKVILETVSRDKIVLGIPLYGRYWKEGAESGGEAIVVSQILKIASRYKAVPIYSEETGTATLKIIVKEGDKKAYVNGRYLEEGTYTIWYENENSVLRKMELMNEYGLKGAALWALDNENSEFWSYYSRGFNDIEYESEENIKERAYYEYIEKLKEEVEPLVVVGTLNIENPMEQKENTSTLDIELEHVIFSYEILPRLEMSKEKVIFREKYFKKGELLGRSKKFLISIQKTCISC